MKRYILLLVVLLSTLGLLISAPVAPAQVTITLATKVPVVLAHGFLGDDPDQIVKAIEVHDAFSEEGALFTYLIKTNISIPLTITADVSPFYHKTPGSQQAPIPVAGIYFNEPGEQESIPPLEGGFGSSVGRHELFSFTPSVPGMETYRYEFRVVADRQEIESAAHGEYESTISIGISSDI